MTNKTYEDLCRIEFQKNEHVSENDEEFLQNLTDGTSLNNAATYQFNAQEGGTGHNDISVV